MHPVPKSGSHFERLKRLFNTLPNMIALVDSSLRYQLVNTPYTEYFGNTEEELVGKHAGEVLGPAYAKMLNKYLAHALKGRTTTWVISHTSREIGDRLLSVRLMPYPANSEEIHNVLFVAEDITETIELHQKLAAFKEARENKIMKSEQELDSTFRSREYHALKLDEQPAQQDVPFQLSMKRRVFRQQLIDRMDRMRRDGGHKAFLVFTIKNYAAIVEQSGETAAMAILAHFADRLDTLLDNSVEMGQVDKERIAIGIPGISLETAQSFGQLICSEMKDCEIRHEGNALRYSVYSGATAYRPTDAIISDLKQQEGIDYSAYQELRLDSPEVNSKGDS